MNIAVFGAGSTGCYIGGIIQLSGHEVTLVCRERIKSAISRSGGITLTDYKGREDTVTPLSMVTTLTDQPFDLALITLKCHQLATSREDLIKLASLSKKVVFMQNGLGSLESLKKDLPADKVLQGITPFNVLTQKDAHFHKGTEGALQLPRCKETEALCASLQSHQFGCTLYDDMQPVIDGKLLLNLNNAINALANIPLKEQLENRRYRKILAAAMREWLAVCHHNNRPLVTSAAIPPKAIPIILGLPNWLFKRIAKTMLEIDPEARSSMWEDIQAKRKTEIEFLNGAAADQAEKLGLLAPVNRAISDLIHAKERGEYASLEQLTDVSR